MELLLVRHAHAGSKDRWRGDDRLRPLSARGRQEAAALVEVLAPYHPRRIISSPLRRCVETVEPLARRLGIPIEESDRLQPEAGDEAVALLQKIAGEEEGPVVVCTHGETIETLQRRLVGRRRIGFGPDKVRDKGSVWILHAQGGRFTSADYVPPRSLQASSR